MRVFFAAALVIVFSAGCIGQMCPKREFRGVWVTTAFNLDWPSKPGLSEAEQKAEFERLLDHFEAHHLNAVIVQVRAAADAFYNSDSEPWSYWLTGKQGKAPGYDPMTYMIDACHRRNMEFHAWFNLFRAVSHTKFFDPAKNHVTKKHKDWCYEMTPSLYFDPGNPDVQNYLNQVVMEVVRNYDIDGVHLDDYFYHQESRDKKIKDQQTFKRHNRGFTSIEDWRRDNVNHIIQSIHDSIKSVKKHVRFGISPAPVWRHKHIDKRGSNSDRALTSYDDLYADSREWIAQGWVDYIMPQLYWSHQHRGVGFESMKSWWADNSYKRHLYIGLALYKVGNDSDKSWDSTHELTKQINATRLSDTIKGISFFKASSFGANPKNIEDTLQQNHLSCPALLPALPWIDSIPPTAPTALQIRCEPASCHLSWTSGSEAPDGDLAHSYVIYRFASHELLSLHDGSHIIGQASTTQFTDESIESSTNYVYIVTSLDRCSNESQTFIGTQSTNIK